MSVHSEHGKSKEQLLAELEQARAELASLRRGPAGERSRNDFGNAGRSAIASNGEEDYQARYELYHLAAEASSSLIYDWDLEQNRIRRLQGSASITGYSLEEASPDPEWWYDQAHPEDRDRLRQIVASALRQPSTFSIEYRVRAKNGGYRHVLDKGIVVRDAAGQPARLVGSIADITEYKDAEERLRQHALLSRRTLEERLTLLSRASASLAQPVHLDSELAAFLKEFGKLVSAEAFAIWRRQPSARWRPLASVGLSERYLEEASRLDSFAPVDQPLILEDPESEPALAALRSAREAEGIRSMLVIPLHLGEESAGVLTFYYRSAHRCSGVELAAAAALANLTSAALMTRELSLRQQTLREQAETAAQALHQKEQELLDVVENAPLGVHWADEEGTILWANRTEIDLLGYPAAEYVGQSIRRFHADPSTAAEIVERLKRNETIQNFEARLRCRDGSTRHVLISSNVLWKEGRFIHSRTFTRDITDRRNHERERESLAAQVLGGQQRLADIIRTVPGVVWEASGAPDAGDQKNNFISTHAEAMLGYSLEEWLSTPNFWLKIVYPEDRERAACEAAALFASGKGGRQQFRWVTKGGQVLWVEAHVHVVSDAAGRPTGMRGVTIDISARKRAEEQIEFLTEAGRILSESLDYGKNLRSVAQRAVPTFGDWCVIDIVASDGALHRLAIAHSDPAQAAQARDLWERYPAGSRRPVEAVLESGEPRLIPDISENHLRRAAESEEHFEALRRFGLRSAIMVPLMARGRRLGVITFASASSQRRFDERDLSFVTVLARRLAVAIENGRLYQEAREARAEAETLNQANSASFWPLNCA